MLHDFRQHVGHALHTDDHLAAGHPAGADLLVRTDDHLVAEHPAGVGLGVHTDDRLVGGLPAGVGLWVHTDDHLVADHCVHGCHRGVGHVR